MNYLKKAPALLTLTLGAGLLTSHAFASLFIYDGFSAGGENPDTSAGQYQSEPDSTDGSNNDSIMGQGPNTVGFSTGDDWDVDAVSSNVYPRINNTGLNYTDSNGLSTVTQEGAVEIFRSDTFSAARTATRELSGVTTSSDGFWMSGLLQFSTGSGGRIGFETALSDGTSSRFHEIGFNTSGNLVAGSTTNVLNSSAEVFAADTTHLIVANFRSGPFGERPLDVWINPDDLTNLGDPDYEWLGDQAETTTLGLNVRIQTDDTFQEFSFTADEFRVGDSMEDVLVPIPEPGTYALIFGFLGLGLVVYRRYRKPSC